MIDNNTFVPVILITGAARRIGRAIALQLHKHGVDLILHYHQSISDVQLLADELNRCRPGSVHICQGDLDTFDADVWMHSLFDLHQGRLSGLVHNASSFFPTAIGTTTVRQWDRLMNTNARAPFFLSQAAAPILKKNHGNIIFLLDIFAERPMSEHPVYSAAKATALGLMKALARELAPEVRVNAVAPGGPIECEDGPYLTALQCKVIPLQRQGSSAEVAEAVSWLMFCAPFTTGQMICVDGGQHLVMHRAIEF